METNKNPLVCFFDSGIGGLCLLCECVRKLPCVDFTYFADNYRVPYGNLSREKLIGIMDEKFSEIQKLNPAAAVVACNTVTAQCIEYLRGKYPFEIVGIQPAVKPAAAKGGKCLVLATPSTAQSQSIKNLTEKYGGNNTKVIACPYLASYIENNIFDISDEEINRLLPDEAADSVVLGCTHYIFAKKIIKNRYNCPVFDGIDGTSAHLSSILGIFDHKAKRMQKIAFVGGDFAKNRKVFNLLLKQSGRFSQND